MKIEKVRRDGFSEINLDDFNRQQKIYRAMGADVTDNPIISIANDEPDDMQLVYPIV